MLNWLKSFRKATSHAVVSHVVINCWQECFNEVVTLRGLTHYDCDFWEDVIGIFSGKWRGMYRNAPDTLEMRCAAYLQFMDEVILGMTHNPPFTTSDLEQIGHFIAVAIVRDLQEAVIADAERASLIIDLLPREWLDAANLVPEKFDSWYYAQTGKQRIHRKSCQT